MVHTGMYCVYKILQWMLFYAVSLWEMILCVRDIIVLSTYWYVLVRTCYEPVRTKTPIPVMLFTILVEYAKYTQNMQNSMQNMQLFQICILCSPICRIFKIICTIYKISKSKNLHAKKALAISDSE